ncbi:hypothetical protein P6F26_16895 [Roseibacterium sp. SDUM158017]|uniref:hypothetical protein n=1 Tax=Roseicyclus salinarum TaxID=3036773 RepID=UPI00241516DB|nr:hypothetical protein [Roseibacterium sp. SDUM158017]MDG4650128.1 hypothetical protein [Roseibacterium sp. SDUM158017]
MTKIIEVGAGTYDVYDTVAETTVQVTVPTLTAGSIAEASPEIGDTLTVTGSNASARATFQWEQSADGSTGWANISGATAATLDTGSGVTDDYYVRRNVSDGAQGPTPTAAVQVAAAAAPSTFTPAYVDFVDVPAPAADPTVGSVAIGAADTDRWVVLVVRTIQSSAGASALSSATINAGAATIRMQPNFQSRFGAVLISNAKVPTGTTCDFSLDWTISPDSGAVVRVDAYTIIAANAPTAVTPTGGQASALEFSAQAGDFIVAANVLKNGTDPAAGWTGATHRNSLAFGSGALADDFGSLADVLDVAASGTLTVTHNQLATLVGAGFRETP